MAKKKYSPPVKQTQPAKKAFCLAPPTAGELIRHLLLAWLLSAFLEYILLPEALLGMLHLNGIAAMSLPRLLILTCIFTVSLWLLSCWRDITFWERLAIPCAFLLLTATAIYNINNDVFLLFCMLIIGAMLVYAFWGSQTSPEKPTPGEKSHWLYPVVVGLAAVAFAVYVSIWTVYRVLGYYAPAFDFGLFAQMFHNMKETGLPTTTVERGLPLSHFAVHVSPIYYVLLPFYCLFPHPATLQVLQAVILASAVIPMWLLCKNHGLHPLLRTMLCILLLAYPTTAGGTSYDIHENCFLLPLVLWLMYAIDKENIGLCAVFSILTLTVKEDAAVYVAIAALYLVIRSLLNYKTGGKKPLIIGAAMFVLAILWFLAVTGYLNSKGMGVMSYRYENLDYDKSGSLITVIKAVILCPMKALFECMDPEKMGYIVKTLLVLLGLPLITRKFERYILLIPYILVNLISDYVYQHSVFFQYNFGSSAFLLYLTAVNLADIKWKYPRFAITVLATGLCIGAFCTNVIPKAEPQIQNYVENKAYYQSVTEALDKIPDDASVVAHTYYVTQLSDREVVYDIANYCTSKTILSCDYVVLRKNSTSKFYDSDIKNTAEAIALVEENGYELFHKQGSLLIYRKPTEE